MSKTAADVFSPGSIADLAKRYHEVKGELSALRSEEETLNKLLKDYIRETGEVIEVEGLPALKVKPMTFGMSWDVKQFAQDDPTNFQRLLDLGCLDINGALAKKQTEAGNLDGSYRRFGVPKVTDKLEFDRRTR